MNNDIEQWLNHINGNRKRKRDSSDVLLNELICMSVENLSSIILDGKVANNNLCRFLNSIKKSLSNTRKLLVEENVLSKELSKSENVNMRLLIRASISTSLDIIEKIINEKKIQGNTFNVIKWLTNYKKQYNVPMKNRKLQVIDIASNDIIGVDDTDDDSIIDEEEEYDETDEEDDDYPDIPNSSKNGCVVNFINQLKQISNGSTSSKEEIVNYFNSMDKSTKTNTMNQLSLLNSNDNKVPSLFRILATPITDDTKKSLISKMLNVSSGLNENGKMKKWLEDAMKIPFGVYKGIDINDKLFSKPHKVKKFLNKMSDKMNSAVWGHDDAKKEIIQIIAQQLRNPKCKGSVIGLHGPPGNGKCFALDTPILMYSGQIKKVQDIIVGDVIMGDDSKPRNVLSLGSGVDDMYEVVPVKGETYCVNSEHILCFKSGLNTVILEDNIKEDGVVEITVKDYLQLSDDIKSHLKGYRVGVDFDSKPVKSDPYTIGLWLDTISNDLNYKDIPNDYKINSRDIRLKILAGIIDSNGCYNDSNNFEVIFRSEQLSDDFMYIARSLGFGAYRYNLDSTYKTIIYGSGLEEIPSKKYIPIPCTENALIYDVKIIPKERGNYYGFTIDGNNRFLLGDFSVTHNTTLIKHGIAEAMDKPFVFISLGGATDASFLEGHSFTYEGSIYGRIAQAIIEAKCMNPIIYFDELDKVSTTPKGEEIINLLIHLIDPVQNQLFRDKYFYDIDFDLSKVTFIFSFNDPSIINYVLKDRITLIETKHLTLEQKLHIGTNYLIPEILKDIGMDQDSITIPDSIMTNIINFYTNEGGVRGLKKNLYSIIRELNVANLTNSSLADNLITFPLVYSDELYDSHYHGKTPFNPMTVHKIDGVGMVNGLWANSLGVGGVLPIETVLIPTNEMMGVKATGSLGNVIKESIDVAISVAWNWLDQPTKDKWMKKWKTRPERFHVHCPDGSTNKEGPSAGAAMSLAFYSRLTNKVISHTIAMTGEINLRGEVSEIGGLEEKLNAAKRGGAKLVLVPHDNEMDLVEIKKRYPSLIGDDFQIKCVKTFDEVIRYSLL